MEADGGVEVFADLTLVVLFTVRGVDRYQYLYFGRLDSWLCDFFVGALSPGITGR